MIWLLWLFGCTCAGAPSVAAPVWPPEGIEERAPGSLVRDAIGINEALGIPRRFALELGDDARQQWLDDRIAKLEQLGVRHVRLHSNIYPYLNHHEHQALLDGDWSHADRVITTALAADVELLVMISPWPGNGPARVTDTYVPSDLDAYETWVRTVVERYDGDGVDDAPGLEGGVHLWEIDNEPDLHHLVPPRSRRGFDPSEFCTPVEFRTVAKATADAIRSADPDAVVLPGGFFKLDGRHREYAQTLWMGDIGTWVDGFNVHAYPNRIGPDPIPQLAEASEMPVWLTEVSTSSSGRRTEHDQAVDLITLVLESLHAGVVRLYWHALVESPDFYAPRHRQMTHGRHLFVGGPGDVQRPGPPRWTQTHPKLAALALSRFLERWGDVPRTALRTLPVPGGNGLTLGGDILVWGEGRVTLPIEGRRVEVHALAPNRKGAAVDWTTRTQRVKRGHVDLDLTAGPVWVRAVEENE